MAHHSQTLSRRGFLQGSAAACVACSVPTLIPGSALGADGSVAPSERITVGGVGLGGRGSYVLSELLKFPAAQFVAIADWQKSRREKVKQNVDETYGNTDCVAYQDMFDLLGRDDIDAVLIATGDRWHTMASIMAARAGKDIYCEKPCSMTIQESRALADVINLHGRIYQAGTQRRSIGNFMLILMLYWYSACISPFLYVWAKVIYEYISNISVFSIHEFFASENGIRTCARIILI